MRQLIFASLFLALASSLWANAPQKTVPKTAKPATPVVTTKAADKAKPEVVKKSKLQVVTTKAADKAKPEAVKKSKLKVVTTLSVLAALVKEVGGDLVEVSALSTATEDPHFVKAKPSFKRVLSEADLFVEVGRSLELWVPLVIASSGNAKLQGSGLVEASKGYKALEVPSKLSREKGDIHPQGNPHVWLSPLGGLKMADNIKNALSTKDPVNKAIYEKNYTAFKSKLAEALFGLDLVKSAGTVDFLLRQQEGKTLKAYLAKRKKVVGGLLKLAESIDYPFITYHSVWSYLADDFGLNVFAYIEEKSGVEPTLKYRQELVARAKASNVRHIVAASYYVGMGKLIEGIAQEIGGKKIFVDVDCRANESYIEMISRLVNTLVTFKKDIAVQ